MVMDQNFEINQLRENNVDGNVSMTKTNDKGKSNKCNQCDYASSVAGSLKRHLKTHSGEKSCDYASSQAGNLRKHLKIHSGEKSNKCYQRNYASFCAGNLRRHLKTHSGENQTNATNVTMHPLWQAI